jgi:hypothetical protein
MMAVKNHAKVVAHARLPKEPPSGLQEMPASSPSRIGKRGLGQLDFANEP